MNGLYCVFLCVLLIFSNSVAEDVDTSNAIAITMTTKGMNVMFQSLVAQVFSQMSTITVPDQKGYHEVAIGNISYSLTEITINNITPGKVQVTLSPDLMSIDLGGSSAHISLSWSYADQSWPYVSDKGTADIKVTEMSMAASATWKVKNYRPVISFVSDVVNIKKLDITVHGGAAWLYNFILSVFNSVIKKAAQDAISDTLSNTVVADLNTFFQEHFTEFISLADGIGCYSGRITKPIVVDPRYFSMVIDGEVQLKNAMDKHYVVPRSSPPSLLTNDDVQMFMQEYHYNSLFYAYYNGGYLNDLLFNSSSLSSMVKPLNTASFKEAWPSLYSACSDCDIRVSITASKPPHLNFAPAGALTSATGTISISLMEAGEWSSEVAVLNMTLDMICGMKTIDWHSWRACLDCDVMDFQYNVESSSVGMPDTGKMMMTLRPYVGYSLISGFNAWMYTKSLDLFSMDGKIPSHDKYDYGEGFGVFLGSGVSD